MSNTYQLIREGYNGVYIEGEEDKYQDLLTTVGEHPGQITPILAFVSHELDSPNRLDALLGRTAIPIDFELLSIDIDSWDYQVWRAMTKYKPKFVVIEIASAAAPSNMDHIHTPGKYDSTGFGPTLALGVEKGYTFLFHSGNMFFARNDIAAAIDMQGIEYSHPFENFNRNWVEEEKKT
jgi:hypothetical protein